MTPPNARAGSFPPSNENGDQAPRSHHSPIESWLPIATAPRDARNLLLWDPWMGIVNAGYWGDELLDPAQPPAWYWCWWEVEQGKTDCQPTHWCALPAPPEVTP